MLWCLPDRETGDSRIYIKYTGVCFCVFKRDRWMFLSSSHRQVDTTVFIRDTGGCCVAYHRDRV